MGLKTSEHTIGERIKANRKKKNLTQFQIADATDISESLISQYETDTKAPGLHNLAKIAQVLDVSLDELYFGNKNERFINEAVDEAELIVNCYYELWKYGAIDLYGKYNLSEQQMPGMLYASSYPVEAGDFLRQLDEFKRNEKSYENPDIYLNQIKRSIANRIRNNQKKK